MSDERLRALYQEALGRRVGSDEVSPEELAALASGTLPEARRLALLDRVMADDGLRREYALLRAAHEAGEAPTAPAAWRRLLPLAAGVVLAVGLAATWRVLRAPDAPVVRGGAPSVELLAPAADARVATTTTLAWRPMPGAASYRVEVVDDAARSVYAHGTRDTVALLPPGVLTAGATYRWWVEARHPGGSVRATARRISVAP